MNETTLFGSSRPSSFVTSTSLSNPHIQTIFPKFFLKYERNQYVRERIKTKDDDFIDLDWKLPEDMNALVVLFHGLEGSSRSHYIEHLVSTLCAHNIGSVVMHFRGCSGEPNLQPISYHSGATYDPEFIIPLVVARYPSIPTFAVGFSLGGNMLMKLISRCSDIPVKACVSVSAPLDLSASSEAINVGFSRFYQNHLMSSMKANLLKKMDKVDLSDILQISKTQITKLKTFREFDQHITSVLHGFNGADDYYRRCSAIPDLKKISKPTLIIHALDDPFMDKRVIPTDSQLNENIAYEYSARGGHVGFLKALSGQSRLWLPERICAFVLEQLEA